MNKKYKRDPKSLALLLSICLAILLIAIAVIIRFYSIRVLLTALICAIIPFAFITIYTIMGAEDYIEIHDDFFVFKQGRKSPRKVYWKEIFRSRFFGKQTLPAIQRNECVRGNRQYGAADYRVIGFNIRTIQENVGRYDFVLYKIAARVSQYRCKIRGVFELVKIICIKMFSFNVAAIS